MKQSSAYQLGEASYKADEYITCPFATGTQEYRDWQDGWWDCHYAALNHYSY